MHPLRYARALTKDAARKAGARARHATKPIALPALHRANRALRNLTTASHGLEFRYQWQTGEDVPEWFDHNLDAYYSWPATGNAIYAERGILGHLVIQPGDRVLDLSCGDGYYARYFWSPRAREVIATDIDAQALAHAQAHHQAPNITYTHGDATQGIPAGPFNVVTWNAAIEHFDEPDIERILGYIHHELTDDGALVGTTLVQRDTGTYVWHKREFTSPEDLADVLSRVFPHVRVMRSHHDSRDELLFIAAKTPDRIPFAVPSDA